MKRRILSLAFALCGSLLQAQTLQDTFAWIKEKLEAYPLEIRTDDEPRTLIKINNRIDFLDQGFVVISEQRTVFSKMQNKSSRDIRIYKVPLRYLMPLTYETDSDGNAGLIFRTDSSRIIFKRPLEDPPVASDTIDSMKIMVNKNFLEENMKERTGKAFDHLRYLYKAEGVKEVF